MVPLVQVTDVVRLAYLTKGTLKTILKTSSWLSCAARNFDDDSEWENFQCFELVEGAFVAAEVDGTTLLLQVQHAAHHDEDGLGGEQPNQLSSHVTMLQKSLIQCCFWCRVAT